MISVSSEKSNPNNNIKNFNIFILSPRQQQQQIPTELTEQRQGKVKSLSFSFEFLQNQQITLQVYYC